MEVQKNPMFLQILRLQWKSYRRSAAFTSGVLTSVFYLFGMLYFIGIFTLLGYGSFFLIDEEMGVEPLSFVNKYMIYGTSFWVVWRYFFQKMPVLNIQTLLTLPIKENTIVHYALGRTIFSFFKRLDKNSELSREAVPTSMGLPLVLNSFISSITALYFSF